MKNDKTTMKGSTDCITKTGGSKYEDRSTGMGNGASTGMGDG